MITAPRIRGGRKVGELTQSVDLLPMLISLVGLDGKGLDMYGRSLKPLMTGRSRKWSRHYTFSSTFLRNGDPTVTDKRWTYISHGEKGDRSELYDTKVGPGQKKNLIRKRPQAAGRMQQALEDFLADVGTPAENYELLRPLGEPDYRKR